MSAVAAGCRTLPIAKMPGALVASRASTAGPPVPGSITSPARRASSFSGHLMIAKDPRYGRVSQ